MIHQKNLFSGFCEAVKGSMQAYICCKRHLCTCSWHVLLNHSVAIVPLSLPDCCTVNSARMSLTEIVSFGSRGD